jgi:RNA polymerase sigma factor (sigma-70 family)
MQDLTSLGIGLEHAPGLMRLASRLAGSADAEDLVQTAYLRALEHDGEVQRPSSWLRRVLLNERNMVVRSASRRVVRERDVTEPSGDADLERVVQALELVRLVEDLVGQLDPELRAVVRARYFEGWSSAEIARRDGVPAGTVRWRLKAALDRLRVALDQRHEGERSRWALVLAPLSIAPTIEPSAASGAANVGGVATATAKGTSAMSKIIIAATLVGSAGAGVAYLQPSHEPASPESRARVRTIELRGAAGSDDRRAATQQRWAQRRTEIRAAHARLAASTEDDAARSHAVPASVGACTSAACIDTIVREVNAMVDGCSELMPDPVPHVMLTAHVIGAPELGMVVESVEYSSAADVPESLRECLTESMYAIDLGPADADFEQSFTTMLGTGAEGLEMIPGVEVDAAERAEVEAAIAQMRESKQGGVQIIMLERPNPPAQ